MDELMAAYNSQAIVIDQLGLALQHAWLEAFFYKCLAGLFAFIIVSLIVWYEKQAGKAQMKPANIALNNNDSPQEKQAA